MANIFSKWSYVLPCGRSVPIPIGVSKANDTSKGELAITVSIAGERVAQFSCCRHNVHFTLIAAIEALLTLCKFSETIGCFRVKKRPESNPTYPTGITLAVKPNGQRALITTYPCLTTDKCRRKRFYLGTEECWTQTHDAQLEKAIEFRNEAIAKYRDEFINRAVESLRLLRETIRAIK